MAYEDKKITKPKSHNVIMENREKMSITGVSDVISFNTESIVIETEMGILTIEGNDLRISRLNLENSEMILEGEIANCEYSDESVSKGGFFSRMFR